VDVREKREKREEQGAGEEGERETVFEFVSGDRFGK
jgi:hypothetical protein